MHLEWTAESNPNTARDARDARRLALWPEMVAALGNVVGSLDDNPMYLHAAEIVDAIDWHTIRAVLKRAKEVDHAG